MYKRQDLEKYFDTVNQSKLIEVLSRTIKDGRVISLIHKYLRAGVIIKHSFEETEIGVPQGGDVYKRQAFSHRPFEVALQGGVFLENGYCVEKSKRVF